MSAIMYIMVLLLNYNSSILLLVKSSNPIKDESTLAHIIYMIVLNLSVSNEYKVNWLRKIKYYHICGPSYIALHKWYADVSTSSMCTIYRRSMK